MLGYAALSQEAISDLPDADELSTEGPFILLLRDPASLKIFLVELDPYQQAS